MTIISHLPPATFQDEIDFFSFFRVLWRRRKLIASAALFTSVLGVIFAFAVTPIYEVGTVLRPATLKALDALNRSQVYSLPADEALARVGAALDSYEARFNYFRARPELVKAYSSPDQSTEQAFFKFNEALKLVQPDPKKTNLLSAFIGLKMQYKEGLEGDCILNEFVRYTIERERTKLSEDLKGIISNRLEELDTKLAIAMSAYESEKQSKIARMSENDAIKRAQLEDELKALRVQLKMRREARLAQLDEAISIARSLGLKKPATPSSMAEEVAGTTNIIRTEVNNQQAPLYFMGADVLEAERYALRKRKSDDFTEPRISQIRKELLMLASNREVEMLKARQNEIVFLNGIAALKAEQARLKNIQTDMRKLQLVSIDEYAVQPTKPLKPRKVLIVALALMAGLVLGALIALLREMFKTRLRHLRRLEMDGGSQRVSLPDPTIG